MKAYTKDVILDYLETLYNSTGQTEVEKVMYDKIKKFIEQCEIPNVKETKEYKQLERQWFLENQLCNIYKARLKKIDNIITGRYDRN